MSDKKGRFIIVVSNFTTPVDNSYAQRSNSDVQRKGTQTRNEATLESGAEGRFIIVVGNFATLVGKSDAQRSNSDVQQSNSDAQ